MTQPGALENRLCPNPGSPPTHSTLDLGLDKYGGALFSGPPAEGVFFPHPCRFASGIRGRTSLKKIVVLLLGFILPGTALAGPPTPQVVADNLQIPWALAFAPDGRLFFTERAGRLRVINADGQVQDAPVINLADPSVVPDGHPVQGTITSGYEGGLMGLAVDPGFADNGYVYVYYTYGTVFPANLQNRVARLIEDGAGNAVYDATLLDNIPGGSIHDGGRIKIGPDGKLYATVGDSRCTLAQDVNSLAGKILRINLDGSVPDDNPFGNPVYSYGHRNPEGLAFDPSGQLYNSEHGPTGDCGAPRSWYDEVNIIYPGGNYGWPLCYGACGDPRWIDPLWYSTPPNSTPPAGAAFYNDSFYFGMLGTFQADPDGYIHARQVHRLKFDSDGVTIIEEESLYSRQYGRIREVIAGPDGYLYFSNSNRDGRGGDALQPDDDKIFRVQF
jgi:glucose/arabinose dehydrogenase